MILSGQRVYRAVLKNLVQPPSDQSPPASPAEDPKKLEHGRPPTPETKQESSCIHVPTFWNLPQKGGQVTANLGRGAHSERLCIAPLPSQWTLGECKQESLRNELAPLVEANDAVKGPVPWAPISICIYAYSIFTYIYIYMYYIHILNDMGI